MIGRAPGAVYRGRPVLVLGGTGFLGQWLLRAFTEVDANLSATARPEALAAARRWTGDRVRWYPLDAGDPDQLAVVMAEVAPALAANCIGYGVDPDEKRVGDPAVATAINATFPATAARAVAATAGHDWRGQRFLHVGSVLEYGTAGGDLNEAGPAEPTTLYGQTKLAGTLAVAAVASESNVRCLTARLPQLYGPGEHQSRLLPSLIEAARTGVVPPLSKGTQPKDFLYIGDAVEGLLRLGASNGPAPTPVNLATGQIMTVQAFSLTAAHVLQLDPDLLRFVREVPDGEIYHGPVAIERLRQRTGWAPPTTVADGVGYTIGRDRDALNPTTWSRGADAPSA